MLFISISTSIYICVCLFFFFCYLFVLRSVKVWGLGAPTPHFSLEGHERGVNAIDYYPGGDRPYLLSGKYLPTSGCSNGGTPTRFWRRFMHTLHAY